MSATGLRIHKDTYLDSLLLMVATVSMDGIDGVTWAGAVMASPRGLEDLAAAGFSGGELDGLGANDLVLAVTAQDDQTVEAALGAGGEAAFSERTPTGPAEEKPPASTAEAVKRQPDLNVAIVSVPGEYAALEAHHALTAGLHVLLFSDNVPLEEEIELKERAARLGRLVMGPGAGTAVLAGTGLGFANVLSAGGGGAVGVVAAAGTGAQEVSALLDRWGVRVSQVIGVGGRDLSEAVGGRMAQLAARALDADPGTSAVLLVSKPPSLAAAERVLAECRDTPAVAVFLGLADLEPPAGVHLARTLEQGAQEAAVLAGATPPSLTAGLREQVAAAVERLAPGRRTVRGLFSGGTLCYEAQFVLEGLLGPVYSNEPLRKECGLPAPEGAHVLLDLGAEEYTHGRPHPMIDPSLRLEMLRAQADDPDVAVVLLDVVLGHGSHEDPAGQVAPVCAKLMEDGGPQVVAYLLGTEEDPQVYSRQRAILEQAGCIVPETNARAAYAAGALVLRRPELAEAGT
ncbi:MAG: protein FdrA [Frankiales bacterium]|nr:protein FdrA [Frankiales bacterium]